MGVLMGQDDDQDCIEHVWRLGDVEFREDGSWSPYSCERCDAALLVPPNGEHPETV